MPRESTIPRRAFCAIPSLCALLALSLGCLPCPPLTCPERGGPRWSELASPHLVLKTDADLAEATRMIARFELLYDALAQVMPRPRRATTGKLEVVVFERREDYAAVVGAGRWSAGFFAQKLEADFEPQPIMAFYDDDRVGRDTVFVHELAHRFLRERFASPPPWLDEGIAQFYSTMRVDGDRVVVGERRPDAYVDFTSTPCHAARIVTAPSVRELLAADGHAFHARGSRQAFYAAAWRLVHLLSSRAGSRFSSFLGALERGEDGRAAFAKAFGDDLAWVEAAYQEYLTVEEPPTNRVAYRPTSAATVTHRPMRDVAVHLLWARLRSWGGRGERASARELREALAREPDSAEARYLLARLYVRLGRDADAARELDAALAARPDDPRFLYARLVAQPPTGARWDESRRALLARLSRVARSAAQLGLVADELGVTGDRVNEALVFAEWALRADPMCWSCEKTRSRILFGGGRYEEAVAAADRALALVPEGEPASGLRSEREFLARLRDADRAASGASFAVER